MVLILSVPDDLTTDHVLAWLDSWEQPWKRVGPGDHISIRKITTSELGVVDFALDIEGLGGVQSGGITSYWYRRGHLSIADSRWGEGGDTMPEQLRVHLGHERNSLDEAIHKALKRLPHLNSHFDNSINKVDVLGIAGRLGLAVPRTLVTSVREELKHFVQDCGTVVTKGLHSGFFFEEGGEPFEGLTREVAEQEVDYMDKHFHVSLFQEKLNKRYEIRSFYLDGDFYSMAIFSQSNPRTAIDFRNYDSQMPNRTVPYRLPTEIEGKLTALMQELDLNCGSIDMVRTVDGAYVFLEVNPIGQFGQVSVPCNYALEMRVAQYLSGRSNEHEELPN